MRRWLIRSTLTLMLLPGLSLAQETAVKAWTPAGVKPAAAQTTQDGTAIQAAAPSVTETAVAAVQDDTTVAATAPSAVKADGSIGAPVAGKGQIVFFRPSKFTGGAIGFKVREGETELGKLRSGKYFIANVEPGTHVYTVHSEAKDVLTMEVEAGETYYVQGTITMGLMVGRPNLSPSDMATFNGMANKLKLAN